MASPHTQAVNENKGRVARSVALAFSLYLAIVIYYRFPADQQILATVLIAIGLAGQFVASVIVARDFWTSFPSERHRIAQLILVLLFFNVLAVLVYVLWTRNGLLKKISHGDQPGS